MRFVGIYSVAVFALTTLFMLPGGFDPAFFPRIAVLGALLSIVFVVKAFSKSKSEFPINALTISKAGLVCATALSLSVAVNPGEALGGLGAEILYLSLLILFVGESDWEKLKEKAFKTISVLVLIGGVIGFAQAFDGLKFIPATTLPSGFSIHKNSFASWLILAIPMALYSGAKHGFAWRVISALALTFAGFNIYAARSRAGITAAVLFIALFALQLLIKKVSSSTVDKSSRRGIYYALTAFFVAGLGLGVATEYFSSGSLDKTQNRFSFAAGASADSSTTSRFQAWGRAYELGLEKPLTGVGADNWKIAYSEKGLGSFYKDIQSGYVSFIYPHNDFLDAFAETGAPGLIFFSMFFFAGFYYAGRAVFSKTGDAELGALVFACLSGFLLISFLDFPKERVEHNLLFILLLTAAYKSSGLQSRTISIKKPLAIGFAFVCAFASIFAFVRIDSDRRSPAIMSARASKNWKAVIRLAEEADKPPFVTVNAVGVPFAYFAGEGYYMSGNYAKAAEKYRSALEASPGRPHVLNDLGSCLSMSGDRPAAIKIYEKALEISPGFDDARVNLAVCHYQDSLFDKAYEEISKCDTNSPNPNVKKFKEIFARAAGK